RVLFSEAYQKNPCSTKREYLASSCVRLPPITALNPESPPVSRAAYAAWPVSSESSRTPPCCFASDRHSSSAGSRQPSPRERQPCCAALLVYRRPYRRQF